MSREVLFVSRLSKRYGRTVAIRDVEFSLGRGVYGFIGPNGAGKTTTMKCIVGLVKPDNGLVLFQGRDILDRRNSYLKKYIGFVPEQPILPESVKVLDFLVELGFLEGASRADARRDALRALEHVGLREKHSVKIGALSKGQKKRLLVAQALLSPRTLYVFDEPFSGIDPEGFKELRELIASLSRNSSVLLSSHILGEVEGLAKYVILIYRGRILFKGSIDEALLKASKGKFLVEIEVEDANNVKEILSDIYSSTRVISPNRIIVEVDARDAVAELIRILASSGVKIYAVYPRRKSLEEFYIDLIRGG